MDNWLKKIEEEDEFNEAYLKRINTYTSNFFNVCKRVNNAVGRLEEDILRRYPIEFIPKGIRSGACKEFIYNKHGRFGFRDIPTIWTYNEISFSRCIKFDLLESNLIITASIYSIEGIYEEDETGPSLKGKLFHPFPEFIMAKSLIDPKYFMKLNEIEYLKICDWLIFKCDSSDLSLPGDLEIISTKSESQFFKQRIQENPLTNENACFIATACFGRYSNEVLFLRAYRNKVLLTNSLGRESVKMYYKSAPYLSKLLNKYVILNWVMKYLILTPIIFILKRFHNLK